MTVPLFLPRVFFQRRFRSLQNQNHTCLGVSCLLYLRLLSLLSLQQSHYATGQIISETSTENRSRLWPHHYRYSHSGVPVIPLCSNSVNVTAPTPAIARALFQSASYLNHLNCNPLISRAIYAHNGCPDFIPVYATAAAWKNTTNHWNICIRPQTKYYTRVMLHEVFHVLGFGFYTWSITPSIYKKLPSGHWADLYQSLMNEIPGKNIYAATLYSINHSFTFNLENTPASAIIATTHHTIIPSQNDSHVITPFEDRSRLTLAVPCVIITLFTFKLI